MSAEEAKKLLLEPLFDNILLEPIPEKVSKSGLEIPKMAQDKILVRAKVLAAGPGKLDSFTKERIPTALKAGDVVFINTYMGMKVKVDTKTEYIVQKEDEIRILEKAESVAG